MDLSWLLPQRNVAKPSARASAVRNVLAEVGVKDSEIEAVVMQTTDGNKRFEALLRAANYDTDDPVLQQLAEASRHAGKNPIMPGMGSNTFRALQGGSWVMTQAEVDAREAAHLVKSARELAHAQSLMLQSNVMPNPVTMAAAKEKKAAAWNGTSTIRTDRKEASPPAAKNLVTQQTFVAPKVKEEPPPAPPAAKTLVPQQTFVAPKVKLSESEGEAGLEGFLAEKAAGRMMEGLVDDWAEAAKEEALEGFLAEKAAGRMMEGLLNDWAEAAKEEATAAPPQLRRGPPSVADFRLPEAAAVAASTSPDPGESNMYLGNQPIAFKPLTPIPGGVEGRSTSQDASRPPAAPAAGGEAAKLEAKFEAAVKVAAEAAKQVEKATAAKKAAKTSAELAAASAAEGRAKREVEKAKAEEAKAKKQLDAKLELEAKKQAEVEAKRLEAEREAAAKEAAAKAAAAKTAAEKAAAEKAAAEKVAAEKAVAEKAAAEKAAAEKAVAEKAAAEKAAAAKAVAERASPETAAPKVAKEGHSSSSPQTVPGRASPQVGGASPQVGSPPSAPGSGSPPPPSEDFAVWKPPPVPPPRPPWADKKGAGAAGAGDKKATVAGDSRAGRAAARRMQRHTDREESRSISPKGLEGAVRGLVPKYCTPIVANPFGSFKPWEEAPIPVVNPAIALGPMSHSSTEVQRLQHVGTNIYGNPHHTIPVPTTYGATFVPVAHMGGGSSARHDPGPGAEPRPEELGAAAEAPKQKSIFGW
jgi:hypothetical protein